MIHYIHIFWLDRVSGIPRPRHRQSEIERNWLLTTELVKRPLKHNLIETHCSATLLSEDLHLK